ncbi:MAG: GH36-type glycosyl hydrolase domain-containing protein, partial [Acetanaerobacterium sp.]
RDLRIVYIGMFGTPATGALMQDIIYTTVICQSEVLYDADGNIAAVSYDYNPPWEKGNVRFHSTILHQDGKVVYPDSFCFKYDELVGSGSLREPQFAGALPNRHTRKGPGFFAVGAPFTLNAGGSVCIDNFTGLVSDVVEENYDATQTSRAQIGALLARFSDKDALGRSLGEVTAFCDAYASYLSVKSSDADFDSYCNHNLPFQVFYQTFVSRSFDQTQKGFREIGFREIQDIFASMYYFVGMGRPDFVRQLITEWASNIYSMGYANHNFYWKGKEPGVYSDDSLWLLQAVGRYIDLTGDLSYLDEEITMADGGKRRLWETMCAIITYSAKISVGRHGFPLIDAADWNDCLHIDPDCLNGVDKEEAYNRQLEKGGQFGDPFESDLSESIMNAFLLKAAIDISARLASAKGDSSGAKAYRLMSAGLAERLQKDTWKGDYFARVLFNRGGLDYLGAKGDTLAIDKGAKGTYFLNSFTWSVLADIASDAQIETMLDTIDTHLRTPYGYRMCTGVDYPRIAPRISVALYFSGDRENGAVFKHANTMAAAAMLKAANTVTDASLARRLTETAYWIIDVVLPYKALLAPFVACGNPRFCTQYNNYESGENIGPTLSGTSTWLLLSLMAALGIEYRADSFSLRPLLRTGDTSLSYTLYTGGTSYIVNVRKPEGFARVMDGYTITLDGSPLEGGVIPLLNDGAEHHVELVL